MATSLPRLQLNAVQKKVQNMSIELASITYPSNLSSLMRVLVIVAPPIEGVHGQFEGRELCERLSLSEANGASHISSICQFLTRTVLATQFFLHYA